MIIMNNQDYDYLHNKNKMLDIFHITGIVRSSDKILAMSV